MTELNKTAETSFPLHPLLANRWSPRAYIEDKPVERDVVLTLLEAARWAPSASNQQPWRLVVWDRFEDPDAHARAFATLGDQNKIWVKRAPLLIGVFYDTLKADGTANLTAGYDAGAAALSVVLQAEALGLVGHQMGGFDKEALRQAFNIPEQIALPTIIGIGYRAHPDVLHEKARLRELTPRERKPLADIAFKGEWQRAF